jgi:magnesium chelatase subunit I
VRSLAELLPEIEVVKGCPFRCDPQAPKQLCSDCQDGLRTRTALESVREKMRVVDLPINATEDRVVGTLDLEHAIQKGEKRFEPGVLAEANRGILYVDEVNLLEDHIVDVLLDSAAMGVNTVEREGVSYTHPAEFILVGTMNPEEGELRPQLLDRFGLCVNVTGIADPAQRVEIVKNWARFEEDPQGMLTTFRPQDEELAETILSAQDLLPHVTIPEELLLRIANISVALGVDGHRSDLVMMKASKAVASFHGRKEVETQDVDGSIEIALTHRVRRRPFEDTALDLAEIEHRINRGVAGKTYSG